MSANSLKIDEKGVLSALVTIRCRATSFSTIQAVIFDKDGTLASSEEFLRTLAQRRSRLIDAQIPGVQDPLLMAFGVDQQRLDPAGLMAVGSRQENEVAAAAYVAETGRGWIESLSIVRSAFAEADTLIQRKADHTPPTAGAVELVQTMAAAGLKLGILSSDCTSNIKDFLQRYELTPYFQSQVGVDDRLSKADPGLLQRCFAGLEVEPEQTLIIGDAELDGQISRQVGAAGFIFVSGGWATSFHAVKADCAVTNLSEIEVIFD